MSATADTTSTRYKLDSHTLHIIQQGDLGWLVWLNNDVDFSGLCIGTGTTRTEAVASAVKALEDAVEVLQRPPMSKVCWMCNGSGSVQFYGCAHRTCSVCSGTGRLG